MRIKYATSKTSFVFIPLFLQSWNLKNSKCCEIQKKKKKENGKWIMALQWNVFDFQ